MPSKLPLRNKVSSPSLWDKMEFFFCIECHIFWCWDVNVWEGLTEHVTEADKPCRPSILGLLDLPERQWLCTSKHAVRAGESSTGEPDSLDFPWTWRHYDWTSHSIGNYQSLKGFSSASNEDTTGKNKTNLGVSGSHRNGALSSPVLSLGQQ